MLRRLCDDDDDDDDFSGKEARGFIYRVDNPFHVQYSQLTSYRFQV